jgi:hypothetical protein
MLAVEPWKVPKMAITWSTQDFVLGASKLVVSRVYKNLQSILTFIRFFLFKKLHFLHLTKIKKQSLLSQGVVARCLVAAPSFVIAKATAQTSLDHHDKQEEDRCQERQG